MPNLDHLDKADRVDLVMNEDGSCEIWVRKGLNRDPIAGGSFPSQSEAESFFKNKKPKVNYSIKKNGGRSDGNS